jgi:hypothetical protein
MHLIRHRRRTRLGARRAPRSILGLERLDARLALAGLSPIQWWVQPDLPPSPLPPTGTEADPFRTLDQAQAAVRARLASGPQTRDIIVNLRGGSYPIDAAQVFTGADSGKNGRTVTWRAALGETPVFSGSREITGWQLVANPGLVGLNGNLVWKADVSNLSVTGRAGLRARQLYVDGVRGTLAESNPTAMPGDPVPTYPFGFRPVIGQYKLIGSGTPVNGIAYTSPLDLANSNGLDWRFPTTWDQVEGVSDPRRQRDVEAVSRMQWREFRMPVKSIGAYSPLQVLDMEPPYNDVSVGIITMRPEAWRVASLGVAPASDLPGAPPALPYKPAIWNPWRITQFANSYQFLDQQNEWYYDRIGKNVYLVCPPGMNPGVGHRIEIPVAESLLEVRGTAAAPVRNLAFQGITFTGATWLDPSFGAGYLPDQTGVIIDAGKNPVTGEYLNDYNTTGHSRFTKATPGNVSVSFARNVEFRANVFKQLGGVGLRLGTGSQGVRVVRNTFTDIGSSAITVGGVTWARVDPAINPLGPQSKWVIDTDRRITVLGTDAFPSDPRAEVSGNVILQNTISGTGMDYVDTAGIFVGYARNTRIENNIIDDTAWSGIQIGWGWGTLDSPRFPGQPNSTVGVWLPADLGVPTALGGTQVIGNEITRFVREVYDGGAIYTTGAQGSGWADATVIRANAIHDKRPLGGSNIIYTDGGTRWVTVDDNLLYNNQQGVYWMGALFSPFDAINLDSGSVYKFTPLANGIPYGSEIGGCIPAGNIRYRNNIWENRWAGSSFPFPLTRMFFPSIPAYANLSDWPNNPLFYNPAGEPYYSLTTGLTFRGNSFLVYDAHGPNAAIAAWRARHGFGTRWRPGAG